MTDKPLCAVQEIGMMHSQNEDLARKMRALENEMAGLRLDSERRERLVQEERAVLAQRLATIQSENSQEVSRDSCRVHIPTVYAVEYAYPLYRVGTRRKLSRDSYRVHIPTVYICCRVRISTGYSEDSQEVERRLL